MHVLRRKKNVIFKVDRKVHEREKMLTSQYLVIIGLFQRILFILENVNLFDIDSNHV